MMTFGSLLAGEEFFSETRKLRPPAARSLAFQRPTGNFSTPPRRCFVVFRGG